MNTQTPFLVLWSRIQLRKDSFLPCKPPCRWGKKILNTTFWDPINMPFIKSNIQTLQSVYKQCHWSNGPFIQNLKCQQAHYLVADLCLFIPPLFTVQENSRSILQKLEWANASPAELVNTDSWALLQKCSRSAMGGAWEFSAWTIPDVHAGPRTVWGSTAPGQRAHSENPLLVPRYLRQHTHTHTHTICFYLRQRIW